MSKPPVPPTTRGKPSLIAAAQAQSAQPPTVPSAPGPASIATLSDGSTSASVSRSGTPMTVGDGSVPPSGSVPPAGGIQKLKFKPKVPIRRVKQEVDVKPDITTAQPVRGGLRGRGRGGPTRGRGRGTVVGTSVAAGVFGGPRPAASSSSSKRFAAPAPAPRSMDYADDEVYSDHSDQEGGMGKPIDIDKVSQMSESAPTSLYRDRNLSQGKANGKAKAQPKEKSRQGKGRDREAMEIDSTTPVVDPSLPRVKDEPISPEKQPRQLREDDAMLSDDEMQDRDERGRRVRSFAMTGGIEDPEDEEGEVVNEAQKVDLSESEEEEEDETMEGDFVLAEGHDDPENKLFMFQFPHLFPKFAPTGPVDLTQSAAAPDIKPDIKPTAAQLKANAKKANEPPPEGRIGTLVVMKSGKVKMVMGNDIVMNVEPGVEATFIRHLVHLDHRQKAALVLGELHKNYVVTPDVDLLLQELYIEGGKTPGEKELEARERRRREQGLMKIEDR